MIYNYEYFSVQPLPLKKGRKTIEYEVVSNSSGARLAILKWYGPWRQYCFFPMEGTIWNRGCLNDINATITLIMSERK